MNAGTKAGPATCRESLRAVWNGQAGKTFYAGCWMPVLVVLWGACFALAWRSYPGYQMANHDISFLGHPALNPRGWWFWSIGMGIASVMMTPLTAYVSGRMKELTAGHAHADRRLVALGALCQRSACFGLLGLALVPQSEKLDPLHQTAGVFAMGGMYMALLFLWLVPLSRVREISVARFTVFAISAWWGVLGFLGTQGYRFLAYGELGRHLKHKSESVLLRFSLWEWMLFLAGTTSFIILVTLLPARSVTAAREARRWF